MGNPGPCSSGPARLASVPLPCPSARRGGSGPAQAPLPPLSPPGAVAPRGRLILRRPLTSPGAAVAT
ncbi:hypothetical protein PCLA_04r0340 [Pseudomonas citronellolis]|nr:hypothetical protein PCLA_04r0340 [Pseudomonas citronellolis]